MSESFRSFIAGALGALVGSLVALEVSPTFWWIGMVVGGLIGYVGYAPITAWRVFKRVAQEVLAECTFERCKGLGKGIATVVIVAAYIVAVVVPFWFSAAYCSHDLAGQVDDTLVKTFMFGVYYLGVIFFTAKICALPVTNWVDEVSNWIGNSSTVVKVALLNPVSVTLLVIPLIPVCCLILLVATICYFIFEAGCEVWDALSVFMREILPLAFARMHSDSRLLVGLAAALGSVSGFFSGSVLVGVTAGGFVGLLDVAFLRKRLLEWAAQKA